MVGYQIKMVDLVLKLKLERLDIFGASHADALQSFINILIHSILDTNPARTPSSDRFVLSQR